MTQGTMELETGAATTAAPQAPQGNRDDAIFNKAICLLVELRRLGTSRKVKAGAVETDADRDMIRVSKSILDSKELKAIAQKDGELRRFIASRCLPSLFKSGIYLLPFGLVAQVDEQIEKFANERNELVDTFMLAYDRLKDEAREKLASLYDPRDYPDAAEVREQFKVRTQYIAFDTPTRLADIKRSIFEREQQKAAAQWTEALDECRQLLRAQVLGLVEHAVERLQPGPDGKARIFRDSLLGNLTEFFETFEARNIADDAELAELIRQAKMIVQGVTPEDLRKQDDLRASVAQRFDGIRAALDTMIVAKPTRAFGDVEE